MPSVHEWSRDMCFLVFSYEHRLFLIQNEKVGGLGHHLNTKTWMWMQSNVLWMLYRRSCDLPEGLLDPSGCKTYIVTLGYFWATTSRCNSISHAVSPLKYQEDLAFLSKIRLLQLVLGRSFPDYHQSTSSDPECSWMACFQATQIVQHHTNPAFRHWLPVAACISFKKSDVCRKRKQKWTTSCLKTL